MNRVLAAVAVALLVAMAVLGVLAEEDEGAAPERARSAPRVAEIARDVERVRELEFDRLPRVRWVAPADARRAGLGELDRYVPRHRQLQAERLLQLLGLLPPEARLRDVVATAMTGEVAGYYIPRTETLAVVRGAGLGGFFGEVTLAHELTHALEDQHFGIEPHGASGFLRDRGVAESALHEGTATLAMIDYLVLTRGGGQELPAGLRRRVLRELDEVALPASSGLPRYVRESFIFPYSAGAAFVDRLQARGGWAAVDRAFGGDAPVSSEQIMHPGKYAAGERPARANLGGRYRDELPAGARVVARGDLGEFDTGQFLLEANGRRRSEQAAAGWGGSTFALWRLPRGRDMLAMAWTWDSPRDAAEFSAAARRSVEGLGSPGAVDAGGEVVAVVLAPDEALARRVAQRIDR